MENQNTKEYLDNIKCVSSIFLSKERCAVY